MNICMLSLSASDDSVGRIGSQALRRMLAAAGHDVDWIDIRSLPPVWVDNKGVSALPKEYGEVDAALRRADGVILAVPVYCYTASSPAKAITELFCKSLARMPVGILVSAGSLRSHLAVGDLMLSMMFEQGTVCYPKTLMVTKGDLALGKPDPALQARLDAFASDFLAFAQAVQAYRQPALAPETA